MASQLHPVADSGELFIGIGLADEPEYMVGAGDSESDEVIGGYLCYLLSGIQHPETRGHFPVPAGEQEIYVNAGEHLLAHRPVLARIERYVNATKVSGQSGRIGDMFQRFFTLRKRMVELVLVRADRTFYITEVYKLSVY